MRAGYQIAAMAVAATLALVGVADAFPSGVGRDLAPSTIILAQSTQARAIQGVNVRTGPGAQFGVVGTLHGGEVVGLAGCSPYWCQLGDGRGWVARQYLAIGGEPSTVASIRNDGGIASLTPLLPPTLFTGAWTVVQTAVRDVGTEAPFRLVVAQAGDTVEGIGRSGTRILGAIEPDGRSARITLTTSKGERLDGILTVEGSGNSLSAVIMRGSAPVYVWRASRTILTQ
jgi:hypothetical protein